MMRLYDPPIRQFLTGVARRQIPEDGILQHRYFGCSRPCAELSAAL
jgi:hypothetical protein